MGWLGNEPFRDKQFALTLWDNSWQLNGGQYIDNEQREILKKRSSTLIKSGDVFEIHFDFINMESLLYFNNEFVTILYKNIPSKLVPAVVICNGEQVTTSKWELTYR